jgi:two-component system sensor histidine kinase PilS (NtrC family)
MRPKEPDNLLNRQLRWLTFFRVVTAVFLLGITVVVQVREYAEGWYAAFTALYVLVGIICLLTLIYALVLPHLIREPGQAYIQITGDILITTAVIYLTGGLDSAFSFMYILTIINAGILLRTTGAALAATLSVILYGAILILHYYHYITPFLTRLSFLEQYRATDILTTTLINMGAFYLVASLSSYLSNQFEDSRRKLAQRQSDVQRLQNLNENIIQSIDAGLMTLGAQDQVLSFNRAAEKITGRRFSQVRGRPYSAVFPDLDLDNLHLGEVGGLPRDWTFVREDGRRSFLELSLLGLKDENDTVWGRLLVFKDVTEIKEMEEEVRRIEQLAVIGELAAGIAHEIRNPLASISGSFQMLENDLRGMELQQRLAAIIRRELDRLNRIVNDFLLFARPRTASPQSMDLVRVVDDLIKMFQRRLEPASEIQVAYHGPPAVRIHFDPHQLEQVLWNLFRNAAEAMPDGGFLEVSVFTDHGHGLVRLDVADTGQGVSPEDQARIFDPFYTTKEQGNGLGLSIVQRIVEDGGGHIGLWSKPGQKTVFSLFLPTDAAPQAGRSVRGFDSGRGRKKITQGESGA